MTQQTPSCQEQPKTLAELLLWAEDEAWATQVLMQNLTSALAHDHDATQDKDYAELCAIICDRAKSLVHTIQSAQEII